MCEYIVVLVMLIICLNLFPAAPAESTELLRPRPSLGFVDQHIVGGTYVDIEEVPYQVKWIESTDRFSLDAN